MKIIKKEHKALLYSLFFAAKQTMQGEQRFPIEFPIEKLATASGAAKKIAPNRKAKVGEDLWNSQEVVFTADEWVLLKELFSSKKSWAWGDADNVAELKKLFDDKK